MDTQTLVHFAHTQTEGAVYSEGTVFKCLLYIVPKSEVHAL